MKAQHTEIESRIVNLLIDHIGDDRFELWFGGKESLKLADHKLVICASDRFAQDRIRQFFFKDLQRICIAVIGKEVPIEFLTGPELKVVSRCGERDEAALPLDDTQAGDEQRSALATAFAGASEADVSNEASGPAPSGVGGEAACPRAADPTRLEQLQGVSTPGPAGQEPQQVTLQLAGRPQAGHQQGRRQQAGRQRAGRQQAGRQQAGPQQTGPQQTGPQQTGFQATEAPPTKPQPAGPPPAGHRSHFSLDHFEFDEGNSLVRAAVDQTLKQQGHWSPLYFYGPVGCGKTHLLRGLVQALRGPSRWSRCLYMTAEQFTSNFIEALDGRGVSDFRRKCRGLEVLAIDDVQFFSGKRATLIEFQSTVESLLRKGKQVILSADCSLPELRHFAPELINRLAAGLPCPVQYPGSASRHKILERLLEARGCRLRPEVTHFLVENLGRDVRHLSGAVNRIQAAQMSGAGDLDVEQTQHLMLDLIQASRKSVSIRDIESVVGEFCGVPARDMRSSARNQATSTARMLAMFMSRRLTGSAFSEIGQHFGGRSHSTVIAADKKIQHWIERNHFISLNHTRCNVSEVVKQIESKLKTG